MAPKVKTYDGVKIFWTQAMIYCWNFTIKIDNLFNDTSKISLWLYWNTPKEFLTKSTIFTFFIFLFLIFKRYLSSFNLFLADYDPFRDKARKKHALSSADFIRKNWQFIPMFHFLKYSNLQEDPKMNKYYVDYRFKEGVKFLKLGYPGVIL